MSAWQSLGMPPPRSKPDRTKVGAMIKEMREAKGLSQPVLAGMTNGVVSSSYVGAIEAGQRNPSLETLDALADALAATKAERDQLAEARKQDLAGGTAERSGVPVQHEGRQ